MNVNDKFQFADFQLQKCLKTTKTMSYDKKYDKQQNKQEKIKQLIKNRLDSSQNFNQSIQKSSKDSILSEYYKNIFGNKIQYCNQNSLSKNQSILFKISEDQLQKIINQHQSESFKQKKQAQLRDKLLQNNFFFLAQNLNYSKVNINVKLLQHKSNFEVVQILCQLGKYGKKYSVFNVFEESWRHSCEQIGFGSYGSVFSCKSHLEQKFAVKCLKHSQLDSQSIKSHIKQFFIADMMSAISIGPKILRKFSFDFIIFKNCLEFDMELCKQIKIEQIDETLAQNIICMHNLGIVHCDIKPENIMFSQSYQRNVFLDFGIAEICKQKIWNSTLTKFKGTYEYCGQQMKKLYSSKSLGSVKLYLNDSEMLRKSIINIRIQNNNRVLFSLVAQANLTQVKENLERNIFIFIKEITMKIKHILSFDKIKLQDSKELNYFIGQLDYLQYIGINRSDIFKDLIAFISHFKQTVKKEIIDYFLRNSKSFEETYIFQSKSEKSLSKEQQSKSNKLIQHVKNLYYELQNGQQTGNQQSDKLGIHKNQKSNMKFILTNKDQIQKMNFKQYVNLLLKYVSFWSSQFKISIQQKQIVASVYRTYHQILFSDNKIQTITPIQRYFPVEDFSKHKCSNLVWLYGSLLTFQLKNELDKCSITNLMTVLKDCVFLNFLYHLFIGQCFEKFLSYLIEFDNSAIITKTFITLCELVFLTDRHYSNSSETDDCNDIISIRQVLKNSVLNVTGSFIDKKQCLQKGFLDKLNLVCKMLQVMEKRQTKCCVYQQKSTNEQSKLEQTFKYIFLMIEKQFTQHKLSLVNVKYFYKSVQLLYCCKQTHQDLSFKFPKSSLSQSQNCLVSSHDFDISKFICTSLRQNKQSSMSLVKYVQSKINCDQISFNFLIYQKLIIHFNDPDLEIVGRICKLMFLQSSIQTVLRNFDLYFSILKQHIKIEYFLITDALRKTDSTFLVRRKQIIMELLGHFSQNPQFFSTKIYKCLLYFQNQQFIYQQQKQHIQNTHLKLLSSLEKISSRIYEKKGLDHLYIQVCYNMIYLLTQIDLNRFLQSREELFNIVLHHCQIKLQQLGLKQSTAQINDEQAISPIPIKRNEKLPRQIEHGTSFCVLHYFSDFFTLIKTKYQEESMSIITSLKIKKLKWVIFPKISLNSLNLTALINYMIQCKQYQQFFELTVQICIECQKKSSIEDFRQLIQIFKTIRRIFSHVSPKQILNYLTYLEQIEEFLGKKIALHCLFPIYLNILFHPSLYEEQLSQFKRLFSKVLRFLQKINASYSKSLIGSDKFGPISLRQLIQVYLIIFSIKHAQKLKNQKKYQILAKKLIKKITEFSQQDKIIVKQHLDQMYKNISRKGKTQVERKRLKAIIIKLNYIFLNTVSQSHQKYQLEQELVQYFIKRYKFYFSNQVEAPFFSGKSIKDRIIENESERNKQIQLYQNSLKLRLKIQQIQYQMLCNKLAKQRGKQPDQVSWVRLLNQ